MNVKQILAREPRIHELPVTVEAFIVVTPYFSYLVDSLENESIGRKQPAILINGPEVADLLIDLLPHGVGGLALFQEKCRVTGIMKNTDLATFPKNLYRISELIIYPETGDKIVLNDLLSI